jgi:hypothetical protein
MQRVICVLHPQSSSSVSGELDLAQASRNACNITEDIFRYAPLEFRSLKIFKMGEKSVHFN